MRRIQRQLDLEMATPGRTHIPWETQDGQVAELISYISFLEAKLQYLQYHHEHCNLVSPTLDPNLPYLPPDFVVESDEAERATLSTLPLTPPSPLSPTPAPAISAPVQQVVVKKGGVPRWKRIIDQMMIGWEQPNSWEDRRVSIGLDTVERNRYALTMILGQKASLTQAEPMEYFPNTSEPPSATESLIASARQYALETKAAQKNAGSIPQINTFRELVFASLCVVMEQQGLPIDTINELMRICMSSSGPANLYRLRRGALWVNRVIAGTLEAKLGWEYNATEFFLLCEFMCVGEMGL